MSKPDHAGVKIPPPLCFFAFLVTGLVLNSVWISGDPVSLQLTVIGGLLAVVSFVYLVITAQKHKTVGSNVEPWKPTTTIIIEGAYKYSRNPIYVAMAMTYVGISIAAESWLALIFLPVCLAVIRFYVIDKEEAYLEDKFGKEYLDYKARVRRWL